MNDLYWFSFKNPKPSDFGSKNAKWKVNSESPKLGFQKIQDISFIFVKTVWKNLNGKRGLKNITLLGWISPIKKKVVRGKRWKLIYVAEKHMWSTKILYNSACLVYMIFLMILIRSKSRWNAITWGCCTFLRILPHI